MPRTRTYRTEALVIKTHPLGEADLLLTLYTPSLGKVRAVAKGARKLTSKMIGHLEPLTRVELALAQGRNLDTVTQAQVLDSFAQVKASLEATSRGLYLAELVEGFGVEGVGSPVLYNLLLDCLSALDSPAHPSLVLLYFQLHLLKHSGFMPEFYQCVECHSEIRPGQHRFSPTTGGVLCKDCSLSGKVTMPLSLGALKVLRFLDRSSLEDAMRLRLSQSLEREVWDLLQSTVRYWLERDVRSATFMHWLHTESPGPVAGTTST